MLFTDGPFVTANDLNIVDGEFSAVAAKNGLIVDGSANSILTRSLSELGNDFTSRIQNFSGYLVGIGVNSNHVAAVLNILSTAINRPRALLHQITVKEPDPTRLTFKRWAEYYCLEAFYRALFARLINDRFEKKMNLYTAERKRMWKIVEGNGFPVVLSPLSCPGATLEYGAGVWGASNVTAAGSGSGDTGHTYDVSITWICQPQYVNGQTQNGCESAGSAVVTQAVAAGQFLTINISSLNPPSGQMPNAIGTSNGVYAPLQATGWNLYVGITGQTLYQQNASPYPLTTTSHTLSAPPTLSGFAQNAGQPAQYDFSFQNILWRG